MVVERTAKEPLDIFKGCHAQSFTLLSEAGMYRLTLRAERRNPLAKAFQDWVTKEVLPSIRKTGSYSLHQEPQQLPLQDNPKGAELDKLEL